MRTAIPSLPPKLQRFSVQRMASRTPWSWWICDRSEPVPNSICSHCKSFGAHAAGRQRRLEHRHRETWHSGYCMFCLARCSDSRQKPFLLSSVADRRLLLMILRDRDAFSEPWFLSKRSSRITGGKRVARVMNRMPHC
jgi:hypothetical protein